MKSFLYNYVRSMRLYYGFVTGTTVLWGILLATSGRDGALYLIGHGAPQSLSKRAVLLVVGFLAWGVNQIFSDYLDRKEDSVNAPHRPMVTGALAARPALLLSACLMVIFAIASAWVSIWTLPVLVCGALLNATYSWLKAVPVLNCLVYACSISCCAAYGYAGESNHLPDVFAQFAIAFYLVPIHFLMCHNSYYKDVAGDRAAGVRTLQTCAPTKVSLAVSLVLFALQLGLAVYLGMFINTYPYKIFSIGTYIVHILLLVLLCWRHVRSLLAQNYHRATCLHCELCIAMLYTTLHLFSHWMLLPEVLSLLTIEALFLWYRDEKE